MTEQDKIDAWNALSETEQAELTDKVEAMRLAMPMREAGSKGECTQGCREMQKHMMRELATMYPGGDVPASAARAVEKATERCFDACDEMH